MNRYRLSQQAQNDLADIRHFIARDKPLAADRQIEAFFRRFQMLAANPEIGERRPDLAENLRAFSLGNYVIFYCPMTDGIKVVRVVSGYREVKKLFE
jgi:toxin ParE1/3/4